MKYIVEVEGLKCLRFSITIANYEIPFFARMPRFTAKFEKEDPNKTISDKQMSLGVPFTVEELSFFAKKFRRKREQFHDR